MPRNVLDGLSTEVNQEENFLISLLFDPNNVERLKMTSEITPDLINPMSVLALISDRFKSSVLKDYHSEILKAEVSKDRKGRLECGEIALASRRMEGSEED